MRSRLSKTTLPRVIAAVCLVAVLGQAATAVAAEQLTIRSVNTSEFPRVTVTVSLPAEESESAEPLFTIWQNGQKVSASSVQAEVSENRPVDVVLVIDTSGSMEGKPLDSAKGAASRFVDALGPEDRVALVAFSSEPRTVVGFTTEHYRVQSALEGLKADGETALYDAVVVGAELKEKADPDHDTSMLVLSDGGDTQSVGSLDSAVKAVGSADVPVFGIALKSPEHDEKPLKIISERSGGKLVSVASADDLARTFAGIAHEMLNRYDVTYTGDAPSTTELEIKVGAEWLGDNGFATIVVPNPAFGTLVPIETVSGEDYLTPPPNDGWRLPLIAVLTFGSLGMLAFGIASMLTREPNAIAQVRYYEQVSGGGQAQGELDGDTFKGRVMQVVGSVAERRGFTGLVQTKLERAGLPLRANEYIALHVVATTLIALAVQLLTGNLLLVIVAVVVVVIVPMVMVESAITRRTQRFEEQLPDVLTMIASSLRSGWGIQQAIDLIGQEASEPAASEFRRVQSETRLGLPLETALAKMADRLSSADFHWTVAAISIQRDVGGNLAEVLDIVAGTIRERAELRRHVHSLTAESRFSMIVLVILPFVLLAGMFAINRRFVQVLFGTPVGLATLGFGAVLLAVGIFWLLRLTKVEI